MKRLLALTFLLVLACGKRGDPRPPVPMIPQATSDLVVTQRGTKVLLTWSYPSLTTAGKSLRDVRRVVVYRYTEELPVPQGGRDANAILPGDIDTTVPEPVARFAKVPQLSAAQFAKLRQRVDSIESANLGTATAGTRIGFEDAPEFQTTDGRPVRLTYAVVTETVSASSDVSNLATIVPLAVAVPPASLTATAKAEGVALTWRRPERAATGGNAAPVLTGYNVYRSAAGSPTEELVTPINTAPVTGTTYTDVPPYGDYQYRVTAVAAANQPRIESDPSNAATATYKDLVPPPPPASVTALVGTRSVRLVWENVDAPDLWGFLIYRVERGAKIKLSPGPVTATHFEDISVDPGIAYHYEVTSYDRSRNESASTKSEEVLVPKTP